MQLLIPNFEKHWKKLKDTVTIAIELSPDDTKIKCKLGDRREINKKENLDIRKQKMISRPKKSYITRQIALKAKQSPKKIYNLPTDSDTTDESLINRNIKVNKELRKTLQDIPTTSRITKLKSKPKKSLNKIFSSKVLINKLPDTTDNTQDRDNNFQNFRTTRKNKLGEDLELIRKNYPIEPGGSPENIHTLFDIIPELEQEDLCKEIDPGPTNKIKLNETRRDNEDNLPKVRMKEHCKKYWT